MPTSSPAIARATRADIDDFLSHKRFAAVGLSRDPKDFTRSLIAEFERQGYEVVPVNPAASDIGGKTCVTRVQEIVPPVDAALLLTAPARTDEAVRECADAGVTHVWMYGTSGAGGQGAVTSTAVDYCRQHGIKLVVGECPFMFLKGSGFPHRMHGFIRKIFGSYPK